MRTTAVVTTAVHETRFRTVAWGTAPGASAGTETRFPAPECPYPLFAYRTVWEEEETAEDEDSPETVEEEKLPSSWAIFIVLPVPVVLCTERAPPATKTTFSVPSGFVLRISHSMPSSSSPAKA